MKLRLKQFDITQNQYGSDDLINKNEIDRRLEKRFTQIENLKILINNNLNEEEYYKLVLNTYDLEFNKEKILRTKYISENNLNIIVILKTDNEVPFEFISLSELVDYLSNNKVIIKSINLSEFNYSYMKEYYDLDSVKFIIFNKEDDFLNIYRLLNKIKNDNIIYSRNILNNIRNELSKERLIKDLNELVSLTNNELNYIERVKTRKLT